LRDLCADLESNGLATIERCREDRPDVYLRIVASLLPKQRTESVNPLEELSDEELENLSAWIDAAQAGKQSAH
jgi:hypothetical protein